MGVARNACYDQDNCAGVNGGGNESMLVPGCIITYSTAGHVEAMPSYLKMNSLRASRIHHLPLLALLTANRSEWLPQPMPFLISMPFRVC
jgi:hypothetical protein